MDLREFLFRYRFFVFSAIVLSLTALVFAAGVDPQMVPFALVLLPTIAALATAVLVGQGELGRLVRRFTRWRQPLWVYAAAFGIPILGTLLIVALTVATGAPLTAAFSGLNASALVIPLVVLLPGLLEEFGWRGFGIPALGRRPLIVTSLIAGIPFVLIHIPLHLPGHYSDGVAVLPGVLALIAYSVIFGWMFAVSRGSALLAGIMHVMANGTVPLTWGLDAARVWEMRGIAFAIVAIVLVIVARRTFMAPAPDLAPEPELRLAPSPA